MTIQLNRFGIAGAVAAATLGFSAPAAFAQSVAIDGSSTVFPITEAVAEEFTIANPGTEVTVGVSGTGGGFSKFCAGETDISNASRPIKPVEMATCAEAGIEYIEIPVAFDALTVVINPANTWATEMTTDQLAQIWGADTAVSNWSDVDPSWPDAEIILYGPGTDSGTFDYFNEALLEDVGESRPDYTASEDDNILVIGVQGDEHALGYFGFAYYLENQDALTSVAVDDLTDDVDNGPVSPSSENVENGTYTPLSRPIFIYVRKDSLERPEVASFVNFYLSNADSLVSEVGYVTLGTENYASYQALLDNQLVGTVYQADNDSYSVSEWVELERTLEAPAE
jgi:phosphate transport system substrate-binding protein